MPQTVWMARHANRLDFVNPDWFSTAERPYDPPLSDDGLVQAQHLGRRLRGVGISRIFASPFLRAVQTAAAVATQLELPIYLEAGLSEWLNPAWMPAAPETEAPAALAARYPSIDLRYESCVQPQYPESEADAMARVAVTVRQLVTRDDGDLLLVGHGISVVGAARALVGGTPEIRAALCCLVQVTRVAQGWQLVLNGDTSHLEQTEAELRFH